MQYILLIVMLVRRLVVPPLSNNAYVVWEQSSKKAVIIDPSQGGDLILELVKDEHLDVVAIINTHCHFDHVFDNKKVKDATKAPLLMHEADIQYYKHDTLSSHFLGVEYEVVPIDRKLRHEDEIWFGTECLQVIHLPGHTEGCISLYSKKHNIIFTGDVLFAGAHGRTDLPGGDEARMERSLMFFRSLPKNTQVFSGHGEPTTLEKEKWLF